MHFWRVYGWAEFSPGVSKVFARRATFDERKISKGRQSDDFIVQYEVQVLVEFKQI